MGTSVIAIPIPQQGSDQSPDPVISQTLATIWLLKRRSTSPVPPTIPATRHHSPDYTTEDHAHYKKLSKTGHRFNLHDHRDDLTWLTGTISLPLHLEEQAKLPSDSRLLQTDTCSPGLKSIPNEDTTPPGGHHIPPMMLGALSPTDDSWPILSMSIFSLISDSPYPTNSITIS
jgi:hypothetical protein